jgi:hypothetical protein
MAGAKEEQEEKGQGKKPLVSKAKDEGKDEEEDEAEDVYEYSKDLDTREVRTGGEGSEGGRDMRPLGLKLDGLMISA